MHLSTKIVTASQGQNPIDQLIAFCYKEINKMMLENDYMLTTSIAYGEFTGGGAVMCI